MAVYASSDIIEDGLVGYWDANNPKSYPGSGATWFDIIGNNNITLVNSPDYTDGLKNSAVYFNGISSYAVNYGNHILNFGSSDWTVEAFVYFNAMPTSDAWPTNFSSHMVLCTVGTASLGDGIGFMIGQTKLIVHSNDTQYASASHGMSANQWYHIAYVRNGNTIYFYVDGVAKGSVAFSVSAGTGAATWIGCETNQGAFFNGYIKDLHVMTTAYYTTGFTRPTTITKNSFTKLLTCQGSMDDASDNNFFLSTFRTYSASKVKSLVFNGLTQRGAINSGSLLNSLTNQITISAWFMRTMDYSSPGSDWVGIFTRPLGSGADNTFFFGFNNNNYRFYISATGGSAVTTGPKVPLYEWINFTSTWDGTNMRSYINGELVTAMNGTATGNFYNTSSMINIGADTDNAGSSYITYFGGNMGNIMVYNRPLSQAEIRKNYNTLNKRYNPTSLPRTHYTNKSIVRSGLKLHLDATDTASYPGTGTTWFDLSGNGVNATLVGSPEFSRGSFAITSDSTYMTVPNSTFNPRTNDFTYSAWVYFNSTDSLDTIFENGSWTDTLLLRYETNLFTIHAEGARRDSSNFIWIATPFRWVNLVLRRQSNTMAMFINKSPLGTTFSMNLDINLANPTMFLMRSQHSTGQWTDGRIAAFSVYDRALSQEEINQNYDGYVERLAS